MKALTLLALLLYVTPLAGNQVIYPPLNEMTVAGTWEALSPELHPATLWHIEISASGDSYLAQITVGTTCIVRRLVASEIRDGVVKLHFGKGRAKDTPNDTYSELWLIGTGTGIESHGHIDAVFCGNSWPATPPPPARLFGVAEGDHMFFIKGAWTRDLANASRIAEEAIKDEMSK